MAIGSSICVVFSCHPWFSSLRSSHSHIVDSDGQFPYCPPKDRVIEQIKERNKTDVLLMMQICKKLWDG